MTLAITCNQVATILGQRGLGHYSRRQVRQHLTRCSACPVKPSYANSPSRHPSLLIAVAHFPAFAASFLGQSIDRHPPLTDAELAELGFSDTHCAHL